MALAATTVWEIQSGGNDTNGGGYVATGTDYSQQAAAQLTLTNVTCTGNTTLTDADAGGSFTDAMIGNILYLSNGEWYQIISKTDTNNIVVDRVGPTDTGMTCNVGGALATPGGLGQVLAAHGVAFMKGYIKSATYTLGTSTINVPTGAIDFTVGNMADDGFYLEGYETTREDMGTRPIIQAHASYIPSTNTLIELDGNYGPTGQQVLNNLEFDGASLQVIGIKGSSNNYDYAYNCYVHDCDLNQACKSITAFRCRVSDCAVNGFYASKTSFCLADSCVGYGFQLSYSSYSDVATNITGSGWQLYSGDAINCIGYKNTSNSFRANRPGRIVNCISFDAGIYDYKNDTSGSGMILNMASDTGASGRKNNVGDLDINPIVLTEDPFIDGDNLDFRLNNKAGGGLLCRAAGLEPYGQTVNQQVGVLPFQESSPGPFANQWGQ